MEVQFCETGMFRIKIVDHESQMAIAIAEIVGFCAPFVDSQLDLEVGFFIAQIDKRKAFEIDALGDLQTKSLIIEGNGLSSSRTRIIVWMALAIMSPVSQKLFAWFYWPFG